MCSNFGFNHHPGRPPCALESRWFTLAYRFFLLLAAIQAAPPAFVAALAVVTRSSVPHGSVVAGTLLAN